MKREPATVPSHAGLVRLATLVALAATLLGSPASAGRLQISTGLAAWYDGDRPTSTLRLAPTFALDGTKGVVVAGALLSGSDASTFRGARLASGWLLDPVERLPLELRFEAAHRGGPADPERGLVRGEARLHFAGPGQGAWMAVATEHAYGVTGQLADPLVGLGAWTRHRGFTLFVDLEQRAGLLPQAAKRDSVRREVAADLGPDERSEVMRVALTTTRASLRWEGGRFELESVGGVTLSLVREPRRWAQARATVHVADELAVFATVGSRDPELYLIEPADAPRATLGVSLSRWRAASLPSPLVARAGATGWRMRHLDGDAWTIEVRAPGARMVEVSGDFTGWEPVRLEHLGGDRWETIVTLEPGVHQVNVRVDGGAWMPPPGAPTSADGYGGTTGVVVAE